MEKRDTPLKTNSSPLKNDGLEDYFSFSEWSLFRGHSFIFGVYLWQGKKNVKFWEVNFQECHETEGCPPCPKGSISIIKIRGVP